VTSSEIELRVVPQPSTLPRVLLSNLPVHSRRRFLCLGTTELGTLLLARHSPHAIPWVTRRDKASLGPLRLHYVRESNVACTTTYQHFYMLLLFALHDCYTWSFLLYKMCYFLIPKWMGQLGNTKPPLWSSGQSLWLQIQRSRARFPVLPDFSKQ
jgi:hypothetical protein